MTSTGSGVASGAAIPIREEVLSGDLPAITRRDWADAFPWLIQGTTTRGEDAAPFDLGLRGPGPAGDVLERWDRLASATGAETVIHARQAHGAAVRVHRAGPPGLLLVPPCDGHLTADAGVLLTVSVADCVPIFLVAPEQRVLALLHAGWRGVAAGILERGLEMFDDRFGIGAEAIHLHLGPAISGEEYEVGPEVHRALGLANPGTAALLDLRAVLAERAARLGVLPERIGVSTRCTRSDDELFSHRGGDPERQVAFLGWRRGGSSAPRMPQDL